MQWFGSIRSNGSGQVSPVLWRNRGALCARILIGGDLGEFRKASSHGASTSPPAAGSRKTANRAFSLSAPYSRRRHPWDAGIVCTRRRRSATQKAKFKIRAWCALGPRRPGWASRPGSCGLGVSWPESRRIRRASPVESVWSGHRRRRRRGGNSRQPVSRA